MIPLSVIMWKHEHKFYAKHDFIERIKRTLSVMFVSFESNSHRSNSPFVSFQKMKIAVCLLVSMFAMAVHSLPTNRANRYYFLVNTSFVQNREFFPIHDLKISTAVLILSIHSDCTLSFPFYNFL